MLEDARGRLPSGDWKVLDAASVTDLQAQAKVRIRNMQEKLTRYFCNIQKKLTAK